MEIRIKLEYFLFKLSVTHNFFIKIGKGPQDRIEEYYEKPVNNRLQEVNFSCKDEYFRIINFSFELCKTM